MMDTPIARNNTTAIEPTLSMNRHVNELRESIRGLRARYDRLERGKSAALRRSRTAADIALEGVYWLIGEALAHQERHLPHVVLMFPLAPHAELEKFSFGRHLRRHLGDTASASHRFRRLLDSRDRDDLDHRLRGILKLAASDRVGAV